MEEALRAKTAEALASHNYEALQQVAVALNGIATGRPLQAPQATAPSLLAPVKDWLWEHDKYVAPEFIRQYINCQSAVSSAHANVMLDLHQAGGRYKTQICSHFPQPSVSWHLPCLPPPKRAADNFGAKCPCLAPARGSPSTWSAITGEVWSDKKWFAFEGDTKSRNYKTFHSCCIVVPYFHGIYQPSQTPAAKPWTLRKKRETLLVFFGGDWRGGRRRMLTT